MRAENCAPILAASTNFASSRPDLSFLKICSLWPFSITVLTHLRQNAYDLAKPDRIDFGKEFKSVASADNGHNFCESEKNL